MRAAVTTMGFVGPILWTELVKCESGDKVVVPGKEDPVPFGLVKFRETTVRTCRDKHLRAELALCPPEWPIVAAGLEVGDYLQETRNELAGPRALVAVPHPTGNRGLFFQIFVPTSLSTSQSVLERIQKARTTGGFARISTDSQHEHPSE